MWQRSFFEVSMIYSTGKMFVTFFLALYIPASLQRSSVDSPSYVAAVMEYAAKGNTSLQTPQEIIQLNLGYFLHHIRNAASNDADIIVFPECGLTTMNLPTNRQDIQPFLTKLPDPSHGINPCTSLEPDVPQVLRSLSCAARNSSIYVVVNLPEISPCGNTSKCPDDGSFFYNSNLAFDRSGTVIARYRKYNLFVEPGFDITPTPEYSEFETDFGVHFGMIICNDILYQEPAVSLVKHNGIRDFIYSTAWFSELPFLTAIEFQAAWSYEMDCNFLAAGHSRPNVWNSGSGIYAGVQGPLEAILPTTPSEKMLVQTVSKKNVYNTRNLLATRNFSIMPKREGIVNRARDSPLKFTPEGIPYSAKGEMKFFRDYLAVYETLLLENEEYSNVEICHSSLCCTFSLNKTLDSFGYVYRAVVFDGVRAFAGNKTAGIEVCAVISCTDRNITSCGVYSESLEGSTMFRSLAINGKFRKHSTVILPVTLLDTILPLPVSMWTFTKNNFSSIYSDVNMNLTTSASSLLSFGIYARDFSKDGRSVTRVT